MRKTCQKGIVIPDLDRESRKGNLAWIPASAGMTGTLNGRKFQKRIILAFVAFTFFFSYSYGQTPPQPVKVRVLKDNANLRAKAALNVEVVGQVAANQELVTRSMDADWVEVVAPTNIDFWVLGDYLKDGIIACNQKVNVRAGPGINFSVVGQLQNGDRVEVRGNHGEWIKITPPENCSLWISRPLVEVVSPQTISSPKLVPLKPLPTPEPVTTVRIPAAPPAEKSAVLPEEALSAARPEKKPEAPETSRLPTPAAVSPAAKTAEAVSLQGEKSDLIKPPADLDLIPDILQGQFKQFEGVLHRKNFIVRSPTPFRLVAEDENGTSQTLCFVRGNKSQLDALLFRKLVVYGRQYWVKRQRYPVVVPEKIILK